MVTIFLVQIKGSLVLSGKLVITLQIKYDWHLKFMWEVEAQLNTVHVCLKASCCMFDGTDILSRQICNGLKPESNVEFL